MRYVVSLWFFVLFLLTAPLLFTLGAVLFVVAYPLDPDRRWLHALVCRWCHGLWLHASPGWRVRVEGRELLPQGPCVYVVNHQSFADILAVMGLFTPYKFVAKASLFRAPLVGWMMTLLGYVPIVRGSSTSMEQLLRPCRRWLRRGIPVLIFPEGTYSSGELLPFKRGAFQLALEEHVPVVPVLVRGTRELVDGDGPWMSPRANITVRVMPALPPESFGPDSAELATRVREQYVEALARAG
ncbi:MULTISPECIES: 1-acyl-sn-glycerol-3-phosphate acyltransferase [Corallococcus]|uniref:lysophospholipid acyltransferase family protein n=1 Tax=Corallococcus TaxID=83461 RepID=UPI00117FBB87|nr:MULTISPECIES: lysophospholipid acyltransferase family protein [Corallococcus]NBD07423.1 1-acylglycerol-3-phosphate O-acyltransferase [Corallococcus silvisoli]TSC22993.1 1-acyl-sn-glycerol-3-phosphate acyltransferase [Corallococcus sp. Z5C101001]